MYLRDVLEQDKKNSMVCTSCRECKNTSYRITYIPLSVGHAALSERFRSRTTAAQSLEKIILRHELDPYSTVKELCLEWDQYQLHNLRSKLITLQITGLRTCAMVTIIAQLQFIQSVNAPALKLGFFCYSMGIRSLKYFSQLFLFITVLIPRRIPQKVMHSSVFLAENLTAIHRTNPMSCLFKVQLLSAAASCNLKTEKQESTFLPD